MMVNLRDIYLKPPHEMTDAELEEALEEVRRRRNTISMTRPVKKVGAKTASLANQLGELMGELDLTPEQLMDLMEDGK